MGKCYSTTDKFGNVFSMNEHGDIRLHLKDLPPRFKNDRSIGQRIFGGIPPTGIWKIKRLEEDHWHEKAGCWYAAREVLLKADNFGFEVVFIFGWTPHGMKQGYVHPEVLLNTKRVRKEKTPFVHYKKKKFEMQMAIFLEDLQLTAAEAIAAFKRMTPRDSVEDDSKAEQAEQGVLFSPPEEVLL